MSRRKIRDIIADQDVLAADSAVSVTTAAQLMREHKVGAILVLEQDKLVGIFTERDALFRVAADGRDPEKTTLAEVMTAQPTTIHPDKTFDTALELMHGGPFRHVPVVEEGRPIGMVSSYDAMGPELENFMYALIVAENNRDVLA
jgi:CBS domain-containing protein